MVNYFPIDISISQATRLQEEFSQEIVLSDEIPVKLETIGGAMLHSRGDSITASIAILRTDQEFKKFEVLEKDVLTEKVAFPAIPCFEGFREGRVLSNMITHFDIPQVYMIDGHGINHPRKFGLASHVGISMNIATIGVARDLICGKVYTFEGKECVFENEEKIAEVVRKEPKSIPLYVSPGNKITLDTAVKIVKKCLVNGPLPEPLKIAQQELLKSIKILNKCH